jgi:UDP-N-acetylglucosamine 4,6-dehydratase
MSQRMQSMKGELLTYFNGKEILITGGTGSLGKTLTKLLITEHKPKGIRIFSRDELKQWSMRADLKSAFPSAPVAFLLGDVRDEKRLKRAFNGVDVVIHTAALKQVPACEEHPLEAVQTNILGASNVLSTAIDCGVERVMNVSTDKAVKPVNLYGATKMAAEKLFINGNVYTGGHKTKFACCRYGNVLGSRGSVAHVFKAQADSGEPITITHKSMTRFWITLPQVGRFLLARVADMTGGEVFVPKMKSMGIFQMACAMTMRGGYDLGNNHISPPKEPAFITTGIRQGEKLHESLFCEEEYICEYGDHYVEIGRAHV